MPPLHKILKYSTGISLFIGIFMLILGGIYLSRGHSQQSFGCETQKDTSLATDEMYRKLAEIEYEQCISSAQTQIKWNKIILIIGGIITAIGIAGLVYHYIKNRKHTSTDPSIPMTSLTPNAPNAPRTSSAPRASSATSNNLMQETKL